MEDVDVDEDLREVVVVTPTRLLALSPNDLSASRHRLVLLLSVEDVDLLPSLLFTTMLLLALLLLLLFLIPCGDVVVKEDAKDDDFVDVSVVVEVGETSLLLLLCGQLVSTLLLLLATMGVVEFVVLESVLVASVVGAVVVAVAVVEGG